LGGEDAGHRFAVSTHIKVIGVLHIVSGVMSLVGALTIFLALGVAGGIVASQGEHGAAGVLAIVAIVICGFLAIVGLPGIIGGWGLLAGKEWARILVIVLGILHLLNFPLGTALGIYTLVILLRDDPQARMRSSAI
jgi:hypothetical protein